MHHKKDRSPKKLKFIHHILKDVQMGSIHIFDRIMVSSADGIYHVT